MPHSQWDTRPLCLCSTLQLSPYCLNLIPSFTEKEQRLGEALAYQDLNQLLSRALTAPRFRAGEPSKPERQRQAGLTGKNAWHLPERQPGAVEDSRKSFPPPKGSWRYPGPAT